MKYPEQLIQFAKEHNLDRDGELLSAIEFCLFDHSLVPKIQQIMMAKMNNNNNESNDNINIVNPDPFPPPTAEEIGEGQIKLGNVTQTGDSVYLKLDSLNRNILISGAHGSGKTNIINLIIKGLLE